jgi:citrate lyase beta subunit
MSATNTAFPRRSLLFMPGDSLRKMQKAATWEVDTVILDLEDAVAQSQKEAARAITAEALATLDFGGRERLVRVNHVSSGLPEVEVAATSGGPS